MLLNMESTNAAMMIVEPRNSVFFGIDPWGDAWIEATIVRNLWQGRKNVPTVRSRSPDGTIEIWFVSLDWLIKLYPDNIALQAAREGLQVRVEKDGFEEDEE